MRLYYLLLGSLILLSSCCKKNTADTINGSGHMELLFETSELPYVVAYIKRTACFGKCPAYEARIYSDGKVTYRGQSNVEMLGNWEAKIELKRLNDIVKKAFDIKYFLLEDQYPDPSVRITDVPTTFTGITCKGQKKNISNKFEGPEKLKVFEDEMDKVIASLKFTSVDPVK